jgi:regulator of sigma D
MPWDAMGSGGDWVSDSCQALKDFCSNIFFNVVEHVIAEYKATGSSPVFELQLTALKSDTLELDKSLK